MFIFIGPIYLAILTHHHYNIHNNIDNNINNTVSATHSQKRIFLLPTPTEAALYTTILYHTLQAIYIIQKQSRLYPIFFIAERRSVEKLSTIGVGNLGLPPASYFS